MNRWLILLLLLSPVVFSQITRDASWVPPTEFVGGDPLAEGDISHYSFSCSNNDGVSFDFYTADITNTGNVTTFVTDAIFSPGDYRCYITAWAQHPADTQERESEPSNQVVLFVGCTPPDCQPAPPVLQLAMVVTIHGTDISVAALQPDDRAALL